MHVIIGIVALGAVLAATLQLGHTGTFSGIFYAPALMLVGLGPLCVAVTAHRPEELAGCLRSMFKAMRFNSARSRQRLYEDLGKFASAVRGQKPAVALEVADVAGNELVRQLAPLVVRQYTADDLERTAATASYVHASSLKRAEDVFHTLARVAPAMGLVGTVIGLIELLKNLQRFEQLGPAMALALLCTLYGLVFANALYQPISKLIHAYATSWVEEAKLVTRALALVADGKPVADVRRLFEAHGGGAPTEPQPDVRVAVGGGQ